MKWFHERVSDGAGEVVEVEAIEKGECEKNQRKQGFFGII